MKFQKFSVDHYIINLLDTKLELEMIMVGINGGGGVCK